MPKLQNKLTKTLTFSAAAIALATIASLIKIYSLPMGGSATLFSMLFICLIGYWFGTKVGLTTAVAYGILQFIIKPEIYHPVQPIVDYIFAFGALGLSGLFSKWKNGLIIGYLVGVFGRFCFSTLSGLIFFTDYAETTFITGLIASTAYNISYIWPEALITVVILFVPPVQMAFYHGYRKYAIIKH
jgi:thiamine transporter